MNRGLSRFCRSLSTAAYHTVTMATEKRVPLHLWRQFEMVSLAPMLDVTDRHFRWMLRQLTKHTVLYSEMIVDSTLVHSPWRDELLKSSPCENPTILQLGGSNPEWLAHSARMVAAAGYAGININCGCPSPKVAGKGAFGAALMLEPELVRDCVLAMRKAAPTVPISVKCRLGVDDMDEYEQFAHFLRVVSQGGACTHFIVHARKALLKGLSPKDNRTIPPLRYHWVQRAALEFPHLRIGINGGIATLRDAAELLMMRSTEPRPALAMVDTASIVANAALSLADGTTPSESGDAIDASSAAAAAKLAIFKGKREFTSKAEQRRALKQRNEKALEAQEEAGIALPWDENDDDDGSDLKGVPTEHYSDYVHSKPKMPCCEADEDGDDASAVGGAGSLPAEPAVIVNPLPRTKAEALRADDGYPSNPMKQVWSPGAERHPLIVAASAIEEEAAEPERPVVPAGAASHPFVSSFAYNVVFTDRIMEALRKEEGAEELKQWPGILQLAHLKAPQHALLESVMIGRGIQNNPWIMADADRLIFGEENPSISRRELVWRYCDYVDEVKREVRVEVQEKVISLYSPNVLVKPLLPLFAGCYGGKRYAAILSTLVMQKKMGIREALAEALKVIPDEVLDERPPSLKAAHA